MNDTEKLLNDLDLGSIDENNTTYATSTEATKPLTLETIKEAMKLLKKIPDDPFAEYMKQKGYDPKEGCHMLIPTRVANELFPTRLIIPDYIKITDLVADPVMIKGYKLGFENLKLTIRPECFGMPLFKPNGSTTLYSQ